MTQLIDRTALIDSLKTMAVPIAIDSDNSNVQVVTTAISLVESTTPFTWTTEKATISSPPRHIEELHNCLNCGGSIDAQGYCKYCGSRVYLFGGDWKHEEDT